MLRKEHKSSHARIFPDAWLASGCSFYQIIGGGSRAWRELIEKIGKGKRRCIIINDGKGLGAKDAALSACPCTRAEVDFPFLGEDECQWTDFAILAKSALSRLSRKLKLSIQGSLTKIPKSYLINKVIILKP